MEAEEPSLDWLPNEVLEKVFCHLPLQQLLSSCCLVNRRWSTIIRRERVGCMVHVESSSVWSGKLLESQQLLSGGKQGALSGA